VGFFSRKARKLKRKYKVSKKAVKQRGKTAVASSTRKVKSAVRTAGSAVKPLVADTKRRVKPTVRDLARRGSTMVEGGAEAVYGAGKYAGNMAESARDAEQFLYQSSRAVIDRGMGEVTGAVGEGMADAIEHGPLGSPAKAANIRRRSQSYRKKQKKKADKRTRKAWNEAEEGYKNLKQAGASLEVGALGLKDIVTLGGSKKGAKKRDKRQERMAKQTGGKYAGANTPKDVFGAAVAVVPVGKAGHGMSKAEKIARTGFRGLRKLGGV